MTYPKNIFFPKAVISASLIFSDPLLADSPNLQLASTYTHDQIIDFSKFWVSEKLDGVRAYWTGSKLVTRNGYDISAPHWFTQGWPRVPLDGELWLGRRQFDKVSSLVRTNKPNDAEWQKVQFMVFDLPGSLNVFDQRLLELTHLIADNENPRLQLIEFFKVKDSAELETKLQDYHDKFAEGLMLIRSDSVYLVGRSEALRKYKLYFDDEAKIIGYSAGNGQYQGLVGALIVEWRGRTFKIGSGLSAQTRRQPPPIGSQITFKYYGLTKTGLPRFATYLRERTTE